jgi:hypothetical protein
MSTDQFPCIDIVRYGKLALENAHQQFYIAPVQYSSYYLTRLE